MSVEGSRFAHSEGRVCLVYRGDKVCTLGMDGEMRVWASIEDDDCENISLGEEALALAVCKDRMFVSTSETNNVTALNYDGENDGVVTKFTADVTCLDAFMTGKYVVAGSADMTVKVTNIATFSDKLLKGHEGPILSVALDPLEQLCASSSCDGSVRIWNIQDKTAIHSMADTLPKSNDVTTSRTVCGIKFSSCGTRLAVPKGDGLVLLERDTWKETVFKSESLDSAEFVTCCDFTRSNENIVAGTSKGNLCVWTKDGKFLQLIKSERKYAVTAIACHPSNSQEASFADSQGYWSFATGIGIPLTNKKSDDVGDESVATRNEGGGDQNADMLTQDELAELFNADEDEDDDNSFSISKIQAATGFSKDPEGHLVHENSTILAGDLGSKDMDALGSSRPNSPSGVSDIGASKHLAAHRGEPVKLQPTFQPASSPDHFTYRFLVYNDVGIVKTVQDDNIVVEFHNVDTHYSLYFTNPESYSMAALTDKILVLAREGDERIQGKVNVKNFKCSDTNNDWSIDLADGEYVEGVAAGEGWAAVTTSKNYLRLFSAWGLQRGIISLPGSLVSMVGTGSKLFVVIHHGYPLPDQHQLSYYVIDVDLSKRLNKISGPEPLPVSPKSDLFWIGLSDTMLPATTDSLGVVRLLVKNAWYVVCDTKVQMNGKAESFFVTCVDQLDKKIRGIKCRGSRYPQTVPKPSLTHVELDLPMCVTGERGGFEQIMAQSALLASVLDEGHDELEAAKTTERQYFLRLFALACMSDQEHRAIELCKLMPDIDLVQSAIQFASQKKKTSLVTKLGEVAMNLQEAEEKRKKEDERDEDHLDVSDDESQDIFESTQPLYNPLLRAGNRPKPSTNSESLSLTSSENRNPFAKKVEARSSNCSSESGIVFDNASIAPKKTLILHKKKPLISVENKAAGAKKVETKTGEQLKGFQLYLEENREYFPGTQEQTQESALKAWKSMDKTEKEKYKLARTPSSCKRKRSEDEVSTGPEKKSTSSIKSKLSAFSFGGAS